MKAACCDNIYRSHFLMSPDLNTSQTHYRQGMDSCYYFLYHSLQDNCIQNHNLNERRRCDGSHRLRTYLLAMPAANLLSTLDADQRMHQVQDSPGMKFP